LSTCRPVPFEHFWQARPLAVHQNAHPEHTRAKRHRHISTQHGRAAANSALRAFKAAYNLALRVVDDVDTMPGNPVQAVTFNRVRSSNRVLLPQELPDWYASMQALPNPLRRAMHTLGLFSEALAPILDPSISPVFGKQTKADQWKIVCRPGHPLLERSVCCMHPV